MASTIARMASTPALMEAPVVLALVNTSAGPMAHKFCDADPCGTCTCRCCFCGIASTKAMSSLERLPQAQARIRAAIPRARPGLESERIVHPQGEFGVAEVLRLVDVVEEVVHPRARHRGPRSEERRVGKECRS